MKHLVLRSKPDRALADKWHAILTDAAFATSYASPAYFDDPYVRGDRFAVLALDDDKVTAVATGIVADGSVSSGIFSRPQVAFRNGVDSAAASHALFEGFQELTDGRPSLIEIYAWQPTAGLAASGFEAHSSGAETSVVMLDLSAGVDALFKGFSQTRRNELRRAERSGLVTVKQPETEAELAEFYEIHCDWNRRYR